VVLIFDEVITGFRWSSGGAQVRFGIRPDLTAMAKIVSGGMPGGAVGGRADIMALLGGPDPVNHGGTFNGNPGAAAAGIATLKIVATGQPGQVANDRARSLRRKLNELFAQRDANWIAYGEFSGFKLLPEYDGPRSTSEDFVPYNGDVNRLGGNKTPGLVHAFRCAMLLNGVDLPGLGGMTTAAHTEADVDRTVAAVAATLDLL